MKMRKILLSLMVIGFLSSLHANALSEENTDMSKADPKVQKLLQKSKLQVVDKVYIQEKIAQLSVSTKAVLVDARPSKKYKAAHLPSAINISDGNFETEYAMFTDLDKNLDSVY